jgi:hypothetical protein
MNEPHQRIQVTFDVASASQVAELNAAWEEIVAGKRARLNRAAEDTHEVMECARIALTRIIKAIEVHPGTGQSRRLVRFLAGVYNGGDYPFDLTDLRALDTELASACVDYLNYDRLAKAEVHTHLPGRGQQMESLLRDAGVRPSPHFSSADRHEPRLYASAERSDRHVDELLREVIGDWLSRHETKSFGALLASRTLADSDRPLIHACKLNDSSIPLCGSSDGPWIPRDFTFTRVSCFECQSIVLNPDVDSR